MNCEYVNECVYGHNGNGCKSCEYCIRNCGYNFSKKNKYDNYRMKKDTRSELIKEMLAYATGETAAEKYAMAEQLADIHLQKEREKEIAIELEIKRKQEDFINKVKDEIENSSEELKTIKSKIDELNKQRLNQWNQMKLESESQRKAFIDDISQFISDLKKGYELGFNTQTEMLKASMEKLKEYSSKHGLSRITSFCGFDPGAIWDKYSNYHVRKYLSEKFVNIKYPHVVFVDGRYFDVNTLQEIKGVLKPYPDDCINPSKIHCK